MTGHSPIDRKAFKQFKRARFSEVAAAYDQTALLQKQVETQEPCAWLLT